MDQHEQPGVLSDIFTTATQTAEFLTSRLPSVLQKPTIGIVCGSGLGGLADTIHTTPQYEINYKDIPHFPVSTVPGHAGKLLFGLLGESKTKVVLMVGRVHFYEGHSIDKTTFPTRVFKTLGVETMIVTNAAGGLNANYAVGDVVVLNDHLNLAGLVGIHPLRGPNADDFGVRFPALSDAYDLELRRTAFQSWRDVKSRSSKRRLHEGVYAFVGGPTYETRAECRMLKVLGADLVGMSTVPEIIVARHCGMRVLALSLVTNNAVFDAGPRGDDLEVEGLDGKDLNKVIEKGKADHLEVLEAGREAAKDIEGLVEGVVDKLASRS
ncbi:MAG: hypothetical protein M4579_003291 [Chaenotheca gracillima]|nr:MAG: hypothetical protein M4579_003291 [Chaenotheca gracillima]